MAGEPADGANVALRLKVLLIVLALESPPLALCHDANEFKTELLLRHWSDELW
jgi:hypothetical protein